jgi:shikimate kinase
MARCVLVGLPGVGKTSIGKGVARALGATFLDADSSFADIVGVSVPDFLRSHGEPAFREKELEVLGALLESDAVISTGGGVVVTSDARALLDAQPTIWLDNSDEALLLRLRGGDRPLLGSDPATKLRELREGRTGFYAQVAKKKVDGNGSVKVVVERVLTALKEIGETNVA